jgi:hypothetical protein
MRSTLNEKESLPSFDLDLVVDMVISLIGILEPDLPTPIIVVNMYSFHTVVLPSSADLLEAMIEDVFLPEHCPLGIHDQVEVNEHSFSNSKLIKK